MSCKLTFLWCRCKYFRNNVFFFLSFTATALLTNLLNYLNTHGKLNVKAVYLHVLASNTNAISFYEKHNFRRHEYLPYYYAIRGKGKDGLSYVLYINGGQPPWTLLYPFQADYENIYHGIVLLVTTSHVEYINLISKIVGKKIH